MTLIETTLKSKGLTKAQFCKDIGITRSTLRNLILGKNISLYTIYQVARMLNISIDDIIACRNKTYSVIPGS